MRGVANAELAPELVVALGRAAATVFGASRFAVGRDTRVSGPMLQAALVAGLSSHGADVDDLGVLPTPGVAWVSATEDIPAAVEELKTLSEVNDLDSRTEQPTLMPSAHTAAHARCTV